MKIIFLDVDGVLNFVGTSAKAPGGFAGITDSCVRMLRHIVDKTGAILVLMSSWRRELADKTLAPATPNGEYLVRKLSRCGLHLSSKTDDAFRQTQRLQSIEDWIKTNVLDGELESWIVLDDLTREDTAPPEFAEHIVTTDDRFGLTDKDAELAISLLNGSEVKSDG